MPPVAAAYPFIDVVIDTSALQPVAQRAPGVIAVVGVAATGSAAVNAPRPVDSLADATALFGVGTPLAKSLALALLQDPKPSKVYGVKVGGTGTDGDFGAALDSLNAADDVNFVSLAGVTAITTLGLLKTHVESNSAAGQKRLGVAMADPSTARTPTYVADVTTPLEPLRSSTSRMVVVAARGVVADGGGTADVATAAMAAMAGYPPSTSILLKRVRGISIPLESQFSAAEIKGLSEKEVVPILQPALIVGGGFHFGEGRAFTSDASQLYVDLVRTLDDIDFRLKAGLVGLVGDARITRAGLTLIKSTVEGILGPLKRGAVIDDFSVSIPVLDVFAIPESARTPADNTLVTTARANRSVDMVVSVTYGPAVHRLRVTLQPKF
ncbi:hypothetical protein [Myxococcus sp. RHSTA-1-4]|uniref:hypothetical protein n=1 Tax=Myxococcus sp. RHSTA-1-4 TaxID=2874601 RepID=UPI001CBF0907|nr:hypothetical protein [Myxococcus sp. RHSTA-1-4]MBZ4422785.1 hypothetical protein [Myxococcus sp. RHSTA-1-4]